MSYGLKYQINYYNKSNENVIVSLYQDGYVGDVTSLKGETPCLSITWDSLDGDKKFAWLISAKATIRIRVRTTDALDHLTFIQTTYTEWKVNVTLAGENLFDGFLIPEAGSIQLKDKPYTITLKATDGLGLLKNSVLTDVVGDPFEGRNSIISILSGALFNNLLSLDVRVFCNIYESSMNDRADAIHYDMTQQAKIHHRTFLKDSNSFVTCYEALEKILRENFRLYYDNGMWVIYRIPEYAQLNDVYYTDYNGGIPQAGFAEDTTPVNVGKAEEVQPILADGLLSNEIPIKSAKHIFNYDIPPDLINNEKLNQLGDVITPLSGVGYTAYELVGWSQYSGVLVSQFPVSAVTPYIRVETNVYGIETDRYVVLPHDPATTAYPLDNFIKNDNDDFDVERGDRFGISFETRMKNGQTPPDNTHECLLVAILEEGASGSSLFDWWTLASNGTWVNSGQNFGRDISGTVDETQWESFSADDTIIPTNGKLYIWMGAGGVDDGNEAHFKNLRITYIPYINGSLSSVKGDYWNRTQTDGNIDTIEETIFISDAPKKVIKGALFEEDGETLTTQTWYRYGTSEERHFKELTNIGSFAQFYRRFLSIEGTFKGLRRQSGKPIGFSQRFYFTDDANIQRNYILIPPLTMDVDAGWFQGKFVEVYQSDSDLTEEGDSSEFKYIF